MDGQSKTPAADQGLISRRDFLMASAAVAVLAANPQVFASEPASTGISEAVFARARQRAAEMADRMSVDELAAQLVNNAPALPKLGLARYKYWSEALHGVNVDGPITSFPQPIALGCSWNPDIASQVYTAVSDEARAYHNQKGYGLTFFSPATVNMGLRDPRWGRVSENFSEDPWMVQVFGVRVTRAMQGDNPKYLKTISCAKHYICNDTDTDRDYADAAPDHQSFWEYYVRGFEACVREGQVFSVMSAYNSLWGLPCSASPLLLTEILRKRWGFKGYVVSDCDAIADIYRTHHYVEKPYEAAALAIKAGSDLNCGNTFSQQLSKAVEEKLVSEEELRQALVRVLTGRVLLGEFDPPTSVPWAGLSAEILEGKEHRELAREAARQSLVLLKNEGNLLPLDKAALKSVAIIGPMASKCFLGGYSGRASDLVSPYEGIANALGVNLFTGKILAGQYLSTSNFRGPVVDYTEDGSEYLTKIRNNDWAQYGPLDFSDKTAVEFSYASEAAGGIDIYLDARTNAPLASVEINATPGSLNWQTVRCSLPVVTGSHIVFLRFRSASGKKPSFNLAWFQLTPAGSSDEEAGRLVFAPGSTIVGPRNEALLRTAEDAAKNADTVILFLGVNRMLSDEGRDRDSIDLPEVQHELAARVLAANPRTVIVINANCPVALETEASRASAILCSMFAGEQQGHAMADVIFGDYNPGGKLCSTWYRSIDQLPNFHDYDIKHGRTYLYFRGDPLYPFGYGLSYTSFTYDNLRTGSGRFSAGNPLGVRVDVTNSGSRSGDEVAQLYVEVSGADRPIRQLAGFERVSLKPGEKRTVTFTLPHDHIALQFWNEEKQAYSADMGKVGLMVGSSSADIRLKAEAVLE